jgi:hypothetical protein
MNKFSVILLALVLTTAFVAADWKVLDENARGEELQVQLISSSDVEVKVKVTIPGYHQKLVKIDGRECLSIQMPGSSMYMKQGCPLVPQITQLVKIEHDCEFKVEVIAIEEVEVDLEAPIVPSKGHFSRNIDPETVPFEFGPVYTEDAFWPSAEDQFQIGKNFQWRDACGVRLQVLPIRANHVQMKMKVLKSAIVVIKTEQATFGGYSIATSQPDQTYSQMYSDMFINYEEPAYDLRASVPDADNRKVVVVTPKKFESLLADWTAWKKKSGYQVTVYTVDDGVTASQIKTYLQGLYDNAGTRFGYVVLIGDAAYTSNFEIAQPMPTFKGKKEGAAADRVYVRLAGDDNYPDAFISRISGNNNTEISNQLAKIIAYESNPKAGEWFTKGIGIASNQGSPSDKERAEWLQNGGGKTQKVPVADGGMIGYGYSSFDDIYDPYAYAEDVAKAVNDGRSLIFYIGHGSSTSWGTTGFSVSDIHKLNNDGQYPVIWSVACVNGQFVHNVECFGEAWLRQANGGAVAIECASTNESWVPPCDKQSETANSMIHKKHFTFGALEAAGCIKGLEVWGDTDSSEGNKMAEQCHLFGDCTMLVRTKKPQVVSVNAARGLDNNVIFDVVGQTRDCKNLIVTVYNQDLSYSNSSHSDGSSISVSLLGSPEGQLYYTVVGDDIVPMVDQPLN